MSHDHDALKVPLAKRLGCHPGVRKPTDFIFTTRGAVEAAEQLKLAKGGKSAEKGKGKGKVKPLPPPPPAPTPEPTPEPTPLPGVVDLRSFCPPVYRSSEPKAPTS
jgi:hypothetical protein